MCYSKKYAMIKTNVKMKEFLIMKRHEARQKALQVLFQLDSTELSIDEAMEHVLEEKKSDAFFENLVRGTLENQQNIDEKLEGNLENWTLSRLPKLERTVLRLALFELSHNEDVPSKVVINEAVELCKTFGDDKSAKFVNGVLSKFTKA